MRNKSNVPQLFKIIALERLSGLTKVNSLISLFSVQSHKYEVKKNKVILQIIYICNYIIYEHHVLHKSNENIQHKNTLKKGTTKK